MPLLDDLRGVLDQVRAIPDTSLGLRTTTVTIRLETFDRVIKDGAVPTGADTVLSPAPVVKKLGAQQASFFGGGPLASSNGIPKVHVYRIGPLTQRYTSNSITGGYLLTDLLKVPTDGTTQRAVVLLSGPEFDAGGQLHEIVEYDATDPLSIYITVRSAPKVDE